MTDKDKISAITKILKQNNTITLTTKNSKGNVWSTKVYYGEKNGNIYVILEKDGHTFKNIIENPEVFFVIEKNDPSAFIQGIGIAEILGDTDKTPERSIITSKNFSIVPFLKSNPNTAVVKIKLSKLYVSYFQEGWKPRFEVDVDDYTREKIAKEMSSEPKLKYVIQSTRPWSLVATISAVVMGTLLAPVIDIIKFSLTLISAMLVHLGVNAISDYFDYKKGADNWKTLGSSRVLVEGLLKPKEVLLVGITLIFSALVIGSIIWYLIGFNTTFLYLVLIGGILGLFYTFIGFGFKYVGLGDIAVFIAWSGIFFGSYFVQTTILNLSVIVSFLPISLLVVAILHGNNMRDIQDDLNSGYRTFAGILGQELSKYYYAFLVISSYLSLLIAIILGFLPIWTLIGLFSLPLAINNIKWAFRDNYIQKGMLDLLTANLVKINSILIIAGIVIYRIMKV
ncbi:MAG: UbiA family prenyltransferase [Brevinematales bacterium]|nr:UbiA family prenyltransferase [Brevinematales bacterium]